jgi:aquaporin PIP
MGLAAGSGDQGGGDLTRDRVRLSWRALVITETVIKLHTVAGPCHYKPSRAPSCATMAAEVDFPDIHAEGTMEKEVPEGRRTGGRIPQTFSGDSPRDEPKKRRERVDIDIPAVSAPITLSEGMLPKSAKAEIYSAKPFRVGKIAGVALDVGYLYFRIDGVSLGLDLSVNEFRSAAFYRAILAEMIGTMALLFFVVCTICYRSDFAAGAVKPKIVDEAQRSFISAAVTVGAAAQLLIAVQFGAVIAVLVYVLSPVSGGHINPAITFAQTITRKITLLRGVCYTGAQFGGAALGTVIAASLDWHAFTVAGGGANGSSAFHPRSLVAAEILATALLVLTVFSAIDSRRAASVIHIGALVPLAIGLAVLVAHLALIPIDGTGINPARSFGPALVLGNQAWKQFWIFAVGPYVGALAAAVIYEGLLKA